LRRETRLVDTSASGNMRLRVSRTLGFSVNFSVTFVAVPYALLTEGADASEAFRVVIAMWPSGIEWTT
jgi:hypothetical protein